MSTFSYTVSDSATMLRRSLRHVLRDPTGVLMSFAIPIVVLLLFVVVLGGAIGAGITGTLGGAAYVNYLVPGVILMMVGYGSTTTALSVNADKTEGIIARFRTMAIARTSVLTGHVLGALLRMMISAALIFGFALLLGFRPTAGPAEWLAVTGVIALLALAESWMAVAAGLSAKNPAGTGNFTLVVQILPFVSSAFVPPESMPAGVRWFAQYQPFTPIIDTLRGLLLGTPLGTSALQAVGWCVAFTLVGYCWARAAFQRDPVD
jgi:ABC-2 type transport system permease protein